MSDCRHYVESRAQCEKCHQGLLVGPGQGPKWYVLLILPLMRSGWVTIHGGGCSSVATCVLEPAVDIG